MVSKKQIAANKNNAAKSTGPATPEGKEVASHNALKHGILSRESVIEKGDVTEDFDLYEQLRNTLFEEMQPVGLLETMLVDKLFTFYWRHYRVVLAERAIIEERVIGHSFRRVLQRIQDAGRHKEFALISFHERGKTSHGCRQLLEEAEAVLHAVEDSGLPLPDWAINKVSTQLGLADHFPRAEALMLYSNMVKDKEQLGIKDEGIKRLTALAKKTAEGIVEFCKTGIDVWQEIETDEDKATAEAKFLPSEGDLQRIQRYEAHLHRGFMQSLHELQRVQSARLGKPAPLAAALDVTLDNENGFVS
ncbi:hypothetical protein COU76_02480 [Candidatus Peregrinibacteria bacterium CG10_big_fil_rev_8_21_14_0_10_49_10]|nr:MAG: hypothetical protein COU76_02480 [Candidatus Peregrinibacteria bacterium CG10_big_fil_rev_8_21_14_0_10_49_10]